MLKALAMLRGFQIALFLHVRFELLDALLVDEHHQVAGIGEVDLRREHASPRRTRSCFLAAR